MHTAAELATLLQTFSEPSNGSACAACGGTRTEYYTRSRDYFFLREAEYTVTRCADCHLGWLERPPRPAEMFLHYGSDYDAMITAPGDIYPHHWDLVRNKLLQYVQGGSILDLGCSSGSFLRTLKGKGWQLFGVEMSQIVADHARTTTGARVFVGDVLEAEFAPNSFEAITAFHVMEHMYDPRAVMAKAWKWLKPGGVFTITLPNIDSLEARLFGRYWFGLDLPRHLWQFSPRALAAMASSVGFEPLEIRTTNSCYLDNSIRNLTLELKLKSGRCVVLPCEGKGPSSLLRLMQRAFRLCVVYPFRELAVANGVGADLHAVLRKSVESEAVPRL